MDLFLALREISFANAGGLVRRRSGFPSLAFTYSENELVRRTCCNVRRLLVRFSLNAASRSVRRSVKTAPCFSLLKVLLHTIYIYIIILNKFNLSEIDPKSAGQLDRRNDRLTW
jgi:hypothetical protein